MRKLSVATTCSLLIAIKKMACRHSTTHVYMSQNAKRGGIFLTSLSANIQILISMFPLQFFRTLDVTSYFTLTLFSNIIFRRHTAHWPFLCTPSEESRCAKFGDLYGLPCIKYSFSNFSFLIFYNYQKWLLSIMFIFY